MIKVYPNLHVALLQRLCQDIVDRDEAQLACDRLGWEWVDSEDPSSGLWQVILPFCDCEAMDNGSLMRTNYPYVGIIEEGE